MRYYAYSGYLKEKYGEKIYKLPVNIEASCPNRDGSKGHGGCIFCGEKGAGLENLPAAFTVTEQIEKNIEYIGKRYGADKYIVYFQNFTNTYVPYERFASHVREAAEAKDIVEIAFATRPDCIPDRFLEALRDIREQSGKQISLELGLQTANYHTLEKVNRGHSLAEFIDAVLRIKSFGFGIGAHVILNLPWDERADVIEAAKILSALRLDHIKLHSLYIEKNTKLCDMYEKGEISITPPQEYVERAVLFLEHLRPEIAVQRLASRAPSRDTIFCNWGMAWWKIRDWIEKVMEEKDTRQGAKFTYLQPCETSGVCGGESNEICGSKGKAVYSGESSEVPASHGKGSAYNTRKQTHRLALWDIDGTLMHCGSDGTKALNLTFEELFGIQGAMAGAGVGSAMDKAIIDRILKHFAIDPGEKDRIIKRYTQKLHDILENNEKKRVLPGILAILKQTEQDPFLHTAILTSNFRAGAEAKLRSVGLWHYFCVGGFGDSDGEKWDAAQAAVKDAEALHECRFEPEHIFMIGDSKYDVECAKKLGYTSIAVATGWMDKEALKACEPDYLFDDLSDDQQVIRILRGCHG